MMYPYDAPQDLLQDKVILVSGAGQGIGRAAALSFAAHGASVILLGRTVKKLEEVYDEIETAGGAQPAIVPLDLESAQDNTYLEMANSIDSEFGRLDGVLHNAGILGDMVPLEAYSLETWNRVMQINVNGTFALTRYTLPLLRQSDSASVIYTSSTVGREARAYWGAYGVSKFATEALMMTLNQELENTSKIRVNTVNPGATATAMRKQAYPGENPASLPQPEDIMNVYLYLMGADSEGVSGQQLNAQ